MYIPQNQRPYWDQFVNVFVAELTKPGANPPSASGLTYALSRIIWALFNRFPSPTVAAGLRSVLIETAAEFKRRKMDPFADETIVANGDLFEGALNGVFPIESNSTNTKTGTQSITATQVPDLKVVKLSELLTAINAGKSIQEVFAMAKSATDAQPSAGPQPPVNNDYVEPGCEKFSEAPNIHIVDVEAENIAEANHLLSLKAFSLAQMAGAPPSKLQELSNKCADTTRVLLKLYKGEKSS